MRDTHYMKEKDEFLFLYRFNLLAYLKVSNEFHPDKMHMDRKHFDDSQVIREKLGNVIHFDKPARSNASMFPVNVNLPETHLDTVEDLENYIAELNKRKAGFAMSAMHYKVSLNVIQNKVNANLYDLLSQYNSVRLQPEAEAALSYLVEAAGLDDTQEYGFYSELLNNKYAWNGVSAVLINTIEEFNKQVFSAEEAEKALALECECHNHMLDIGKKVYIRKSFALIVAYRAQGNDAGNPLWAYRCPKFSDSNVWHITKRDQRGY